MKNICIVLTSYSRYPVGGYKIVYEYANRLVQKGYGVTILFMNNTALKQYHIPECLRKMIVSKLTQIEPKWFELDSKIKKISSLDVINEKFQENIDIAIATSVLSVEYVQKLFCEKKCLYFIQGYEIWDASEEYLSQTYNGGMNNIVISKWLKNKVDAVTKKESVLIRNPIDINVYKIINSLEDRPFFSIGFLYHEQEYKGVEDLLEVLRTLKREYPQMIVKSFGMYKRPKKLPDWIEYTSKASQNETVKIYNSVQVFACATIEEGFGLTGLEAMACGCALASTSYEGIKEYAIDGYNALLSPVKDRKALADNIRKLFADNELKKNLILNGIKTAKCMSWEKATESMISVIEK